MDKPEILAKLPGRWNGEAIYVAKHGRALWERICDAITTSDWFTIKEVIQQLNLPITTTSRRYVMSVFSYVRAETGDEVLLHEGNSWRWA